MSDFLLAINGNKALGTMNIFLCILLGIALAMSKYNWQIMKVD